MRYEALLVVSFGGPERPEDVMPFLEDVTRGRGVPRERLLEVASHYEALGGCSPIQAQTRALLAALEAELRDHGIALPIHWGTRHAHPRIEDAVRAMRQAGIRRALALTTSAFPSYSGCRQYREAIDRARAAVGAQQLAIDLIGPYGDEPGFLAASVERAREAMAALGRSSPFVLFTAHSIPIAMARTSRYEAALRAAAGKVADALGVSDRWELAWQSRSGPSEVPWLEPDVGDALADLAARGVRDVVVVPIGFISDHVEVLWDLDRQAKARADALGVRMVRAGTVGVHPLFVAALRARIEAHLRGERTAGCAPDCCPPPPRR